MLNQLGLDGRLRAMNEVEANSMRIAGIGGGRVGDAMVVVGNLLLDFDYPNDESSLEGFGSRFP
ncbi:MAG: hypothetical protein CM15mP45_16540 [Deltaproteobacteria bacterium]|nr:MAG: hypothetical protein CM15mP45_16540 [Deltaproteobacteria bacterium]